MGNFETATNASATALDAAGSAARENARYMESLEARTNQLKAVFQDLSNNVINSDLVKSFLDLATGALKIANTEVGQAVIKWGLLSGVLTGVGSIGIQVIPKLISPLIEIGKALFVGATGVTSFSTAFKIFGVTLSTAMPLIAGIASILAVVLIPKIQEASKSFQELQEEAKASQGQLESNQKRLEEINDIPWYNRSADVLAEKAAIEKENDELKKQIEHYDKLAVKKAEKALSGKTVVSVTAEDDYSPIKQETILNTTKYADVLEDLNRALEEQGYLTDKQSDEYEKLKAKIDNQYAAIVLLKEKGIRELTDEENRLYDQMTKLEQNNSNFVKMSNVTTNSLRIEADATEEARKKVLDLSKQFLEFSRQQISVSGKVQSFNEIAAAAANAGVAILSAAELASEMESDPKFKQNWKRKYGSYTGYVKAKQEEAIRRLTYKMGTVSSDTGTTVTDYGSSSGSGGTTSSATSEASNKLREISNQIDIINAKYDAELKTLEKQNDELENQLDLEKKLADLAEAREKRQLVYSGGKYVYMQDYDAISNAQNALNEYYRQQNLANKKADVEARRNAELAPWKQQQTYWQTHSHASGTTGAMGGLSLVGENGPELRVLRSGDGILPADITRNLWAWGSINPNMLANSNSMGGNVYNFGNISLPSVTNAQQFVDGIKRLAYQRAYHRG